MVIRAGVDTGGTFTDLVVFDSESSQIQSSKSLSTHKTPVTAFSSTLDKLKIDPESVSELVHGTTIATNALIERKGGSVAYVTTAGFEDVPFIQRTTRPELYNLAWEKSLPMVERRADCYGLPERLLYDGSVLRPLHQADIDALVSFLKHSNYDAVAVCLLFSFINPMHELMIKKRLQEKLPDIPCSISSEVAPIWREYDRASSTIADAFVKPVVSKYVNDLTDGLASINLRAPLMIMKSNGGMMASHTCATSPIQSMMSGPAGGMIACQSIAEALELDNVLTMDMGGTSCDVGIIVEGQQKLTTQFEIEFGLTVSIPMIDIRTIGAGGGSIAWLDNGGFLQVGPKSAGADPGPACYDLGGIQPTVTDANLVLNRLIPEFFLNGSMPLSRDRAREALSTISPSGDHTIEDLAVSITQISEDNMANAIRMISVVEGYDPREFSLISFGGAGPLHATAIARKLSIPKVVIPVVPGNTSALGFLLADTRIDKIRTFPMRSDALNIDRINYQFEDAEAAATKELRADRYTGSITLINTIRMRYAGQNHEYDVPIPHGLLTLNILQSAFDSFHQRHEALYGYRRPEAVIEIISLSTTVVGRTSKPPMEFLKPKRTDTNETIQPVYFPEFGHLDTRVVERQSLAIGASISGPAVLVENGSTCLLRPGDHMQVDSSGSLLIEVDH
ncbi:MAG: hydantoin utilization protein [Chloroflexi bacterium]|nr:hydantoin utilization protein [Chloroflexota bacterium]|tara:strand:- start:19574 stop:21607 length:2034 start_codon:yes stop_codon:yes gene_type:complete